MSRLWIIVATLLWIAICVSGQCLDSKQRAKLGKDAQLTTKNIRDGAAVFSTIGAGAALASGAGAPLAPIFAAVGPLVSFITGIVDEAGPTESDHAIHCMNEQYANLTKKLDGMDGKLDNISAQIEDLKKDIAEVKEILFKISTAISDLKDFMSNRFDVLESKIEAVVKEIEAHQTAMKWKEVVVGPLSDLRDGAKALLDFNFSRHAVGKMAAACGEVNAYKPYVMARDIWLLAGDGCQSNHRKLKSGAGIPDTCMANAYVRNAEYAHSAAEYVHSLIMGTWVELLFYHAMCVGIVFKEAGRLEVEDNTFKNKMTSIWNESPKIIRETAESYWPDHASKYAKTFMIGDATRDNAEKARKALNERFSWYKHQALDPLCYKYEGNETATLSITTLTDDGYMEIRETEKNKDVGRRIIITRYRNATIQDRVDRRDRYEKLMEWIQTPVESCEHPWTELSNTIEACIHLALEQDELWKSLPETLNSFGGKVDSSRNHGFMTFECRKETRNDPSKRSGVMVYYYGDHDCFGKWCNKSVLRNTGADNNMGVLFIT